MTSFFHRDFLLSNTWAKSLFHEVAETLPIVDYHNHLNPQWLATNYRFENIARLWVCSDPYKHRAMRICGVPERCITGDASDKDRFLAWAQTLPKTLGSPLFHWSCMELQEVFGFSEILCEDNAEKVWEHCNRQLQEEGYAAVDILRRFGVQVLCTSDGWLDDLIPHTQASQLHIDLTVNPALRGDSALMGQPSEFLTWLRSLEQSTSIAIQSLEDYQAALAERLDRFDEARCRLADHSLDAGFVFDLPNKTDANCYFRKVLAGETLSERERVHLNSYLLAFLGSEYGRRQWRLLLHIGAQRRTSTRLRNLAGPAGGYAAIGRACDIDSLTALLDTWEAQGHLPNTALFTLNPADNAAFASLTGSFAEDGKPGKIQFGPAWWFNDHRDGIDRHLQDLAHYGLLSQFIGMTTDSRSILSFSRHDYFRRILCQRIGAWVDAGEWPDDRVLLEQLVRDIAHNNSLAWLDIEPDKQAIS